MTARLRSSRPWRRSYTAVVRGSNDSTGVALVEIYYVTIESLRTPVAEDLVALRVQAAGLEAGDRHYPGADGGQAGEPSSDSDRTAGAISGELLRRPNGNQQKPSSRTNSNPK